MRVLVADALAEAGVEALRQHFDVDVRTGLSKEELLDTVPGYHAVVVRSATTIDADVIAAGTDLKVIARAGIGLDNVDVAAATSRGIIVCNAPQSNVISAAEHTVALILASARDIPRADASLRSGRWERSAFKGMELHGKTLGVLGLGRVGTLVAQRCSSFGMRLAAYDPYVSAERAAQMGVELVPTVKGLCERADILTVHLPKNPETVGLVGREELGAMRPTARVVNTARGGIVDEAALAEAVREGVIAGAALDVFSTEPMTDSPLFGLDGVVVTPHLGASTVEAQDKAGTMVAESVVLALAGEFVPSAVNLQVGSGIPEAVKPFMALTEQLGRIFTALHAGETSEVTAEFLGAIADADTRALALSTTKGLLADVVAEPVTFVNAPIVAAERGLKLSTLSSSSSRDYVSLVRLCAGDVRVSGTLVGPTDKPRLVEIWGFDLDMEPSRHMVFWRYVDRPGIVGLIGNALGAADVNIASMQVARRGAGGEALIVMSLDTAIPDEVLRDVTERIGATEGRRIDLS